MASDPRLIPKLLDYIIQMVRLENITLLDVGCGYGRWAHLLRSLVNYGGDKAYLVGIDIFLPYLRCVRKWNPYDELLVGDARFLPFKSNAFDYVLAFEVLEHMKQREGMLFLLELERVAQRLIMVSTPHGMLKHGPYRENPYELHRSGWTPQMLRSFGYKVYGIGGKVLSSDLLKKCPLHKVVGLLNYVAALFSWKIPQVSGMLFAVKDPQKH